MYHKYYSNFVRQSYEDVAPPNNVPIQKLSGLEARKIYLEEVRNVNQTQPVSACKHVGNVHGNENRKRNVDINVTDKELFVSVQGNNIDIVKSSLEKSPDRINIKDEFGWSLLMIACQANSIDMVKELLQRGIDTSVRDKAGNSAQSLVIKNKNVILADILLSHKPSEDLPPKKCKRAHFKLKNTEYQCKVCENLIFPDKEEHLSSTLHNINASKGKKIPINYVIPETNKGFQIMLKEGWDKDTGLGPAGAGTKYPIKATMKKDRTGLGLKKERKNSIKESVKTFNKNFLALEERKNKIMEIQFRREFY